MGEQRTSAAKSRAAEPIDIRRNSAAPQQVLSELHARIAEQIAAIQTAGREIVSNSAGGDPLGVEVTIEVGPDPSEAAGVTRSTDCWDERVICGKGPSGYIYCTVHVCMTVGPVEVLPG